MSAGVDDAKRFGDPFGSLPGVLSFFDSEDVSGIAERGNEDVRPEPRAQDGHAIQADTLRVKRAHIETLGAAIAKAEGGAS